MTQDEIQQIINYAYPKIQTYYGKGELPIPSIELHIDIYARLSGDPEARGEASKSSKAEYDDETNKIYIYYPNVKNEEDLLRSLVHEYTHYRQDHSLFNKYKQMYSYDEDPTEIEAKKAEEDWYLFSQNEI
tara:strand:- start:815 stop:1207 length:393 start_codon:yes stop_codon:yes gene_type:complete